MALANDAILGGGDPEKAARIVAWADGFVQNLVDALAADATPYLGDPADGEEERKHRERFQAKLSLALILSPLLVEEILEEINQKPPAEATPPIASPLCAGRSADPHSTVPPRRPVFAWPTSPSAPSPPP